jgi:hypothetical protein
MGVNIFNDSIIGCKMGTDTIDAIYQGTELLYSSAPPEPKFIATYSDSTTYSAACDGNTELTSATTKPSGYQYRNMNTAIIGDCITSLGRVAFRNCSSLTSVTIPNSVTTIGETVFANCSGLTSISIPDSVTSIGGSAFQRCSGLTTCTIGSGVTSIGTGAFYGCSGIISVVIPDSVIIISNEAFNNCSGLTYCTIGSGVTSIDAYAFKDCSSLTSITCNAITPPALSYYQVFDNTNNCPIYVPAASVDTYKTAENWSQYADRIQAIT